MRRTTIAALLMIGIGFAMVGWLWQIKVKQRSIPVIEVPNAPPPKRTQADRKRSDATALAEKAKQEQARSELEKSIVALRSQHRRWKDAARLADSTARIALATPVAQLQEISRATTDLLVPPCIEPAKKSLTDAMSLTIDGFMLFMQDANIGKTLASLKSDAAAPHFTAYEQGMAECAKQYGLPLS